MRALKIVVDVGFVTGVTPHTTPTGSAISVMPVSSSWWITPTERSRAIEWVMCSHAKMFLTALSSKTPRPVSVTASSASSPCRSSAATAALRTMRSIWAWSKVAYASSAWFARSTRSSISLRSTTALTLVRSAVRDIVPPMLVRAGGRTPLSSPTTLGAREADSA